MTARAEYREIACKTALNRVTGMPFSWSLNPYRGCVHGCHYCFARRYHEYLDLNASEDFTSIIFVKTNVEQILREELWLPNWRREQIALGTATDPYQPIEGKYRLSRGCLSAIADRHNPVNIVTKGPMIIRDIDVLTSIAADTDCSVCISITTVDAELAARLEPTTAPPRQRLRAMEALSAAGINVGVLVAPVVPGITDGPGCVESVVEQAAAHGARFIGGRVLELKPGTKEHFLRFLSDKYPRLISRYSRDYPGAYAPRGVAEATKRLIQESAASYGISTRDRRPDPAAPRQLELLPR